MQRTKLNCKNCAFSISNPVHLAPHKQLTGTMNEPADEIVFLPTSLHKEEGNNQSVEEQDPFNDLELKPSIAQLQSPNSPTTNTTNHQLQEWSMSFETPEKASIPILVNSPPSTNNSQQLVADLTSQIEHWKSQYNEKVQANIAIEQTLEQYCTTMSSIAEQIKVLSEENASLIVDNEALRHQVAAESAKTEQLSMECGVLRRKEEAMDSSIASLQRELLNAQKKYEMIKSHAEERLEGANQELQKLKSGYDGEIGLLKVKLSKHESKIKSLESVIEMKSKENQELMDICDDLIQKMDNAK